MAGRTSTILMPWSHIAWGDRKATLIPQTVWRPYGINVNHTSLVIQLVSEPVSASKYMSKY